jgi:hypothetical protein
MCIVSFMHKLCQVFAEYFKVVEEESIRDNFVIVYELLDEVMDYGAPQFTDSKVQNKPFLLMTFFLDFTRIHHTRKSQAGSDGSEAAIDCNKRGFVEIRRNQIQKERSVFGCDRVGRSFGFGDRKRSPF